MKKLKEIRGIMIGPEGEKAKREEDKRNEKKGKGK